MKPAKPNRAVFLNAVLLSALLAACSPEPDDKPVSPNIVVIFADDLGYGDLSCYGHPTIRTPQIDSLAGRGIKLTSFYMAASSCSPSRAALLTGKYPQRVGMPYVLGPEAEQGLSDDPTLAEILKAAGYSTKAIGKWHLGHSRPELLPTGRGFDSYFGLLYSNDMIPPWVQTDRPLELYRDTSPVEVLGDQSQLTVRYTEEAVEFIGQAASPFFLYLAHSMPHVPIDTAGEFRGRSRAGLYGDTIETIDWSTGRILEALRERGVEQDTLVVFTSDNGPWQNMPDRMFSLDIVKPWHAGSAGPLRGAKATSYEGGFRVPGILSWPGRIPEGQTSSEMMTSMDLFVTLAKLSGANAPDQGGLDGVDLLPSVTRGAPLGEREFFYVQGWQVEAVRQGNWKLRYSNRDRPGRDPNMKPELELFDLEVDPAERYNRAPEFPAKAAALLGRIREYQSQIASYRSD